MNEKAKMRTTLGGNSMKFQSIFFVLLTLLATSSFGADQGRIQIPKAVLDRHNANCHLFSSEQGDSLFRGVFPLPGDEYSKGTKTLYVLGCERYAYNSMEKAYIVNSYGDVTNVALAEVAADRSITATSDLMGVVFNQESLMLSTYSKGRGLGDCGSCGLYKYDANSEKFILVKAFLKENCDGDVISDWPVVYLK
jgi:hypothetical protein